jgi:polar amino acid transport system substrate-binding protein
MLAVAGCGKKEEQAADQNAAATAPAASNTTATAPAATDNTVNTQAAATPAAAPAASGDKIGDCELTGKKGETPITPAVAGQLTVETNLPGPGWFNGDTPESIKDGYEYCFAANIAHRAGLDNLKVVNVAWDALVAGQTKDFDLALSQISITDERKKVVDFSIPYFSSDIGVLAKKGGSIDETSIKKAKIGVQQATTGADFVANTLKPETPAKVFPDTPSMFTALQAGQIDVAMTDTSIVLAQAGQSNGTFAVVGQYATGETYGALYPKGSANEDNINKIIKALEDDGTMKVLAAKYLAAAWGTDPTAIPYFKP